MEWRVEEWIPACTSSNNCSTLRANACRPVYNCHPNLAELMDKQNRQSSHHHPAPVSRTSEWILCQTPDPPVTTAARLSL